MGHTRTEEIVRYLLDTATCPRCDAALVQTRWCSACGADLSTSAIAALWQSSTRAVEAIRGRQAIADALPTVVAPVRSTPPLAPPIASSVARGELPRPTTSTSQVSIQSVLAVAGAGLLAVAAIVFTFLNPELTDFGTRTTIVAAITAVFLAGGWLLARRGLQFSAEAIGALASLFLVLDVWAVSQLTPLAMVGMLSAAFCTLLFSAVMIAISALARVRVWLVTGIVGMFATPLLFGFAIGGPWSVLVASAASCFAALAAHTVVERLASRFTGPLRAEHTAASALQITAIALTLLQLLAVNRNPTASSLVPSAGIIAAISLLAALSTRAGSRRLWSATAGSFFVMAVTIVSLAIPLHDAAWYLALSPLAAAAAVVAVGGIPDIAHLHRPILVWGAWATALGIGTPVVFVTLGEVVASFGDLGLDSLALPSMLGTASIAVGSLALGRLRRTPGAYPVAAWTLVPALVALITWTALPFPVQAAIGVAAAALISLALSRFEPIRTSSRGVRGALWTGAHLVLVLVAVASVFHPAFSLVVGAVVICAFAMVARTVPPRIRSLHFAFGYAYALFALASTLGLLHLATIATLCLVTTAASGFALATTIARWPGTRSWFALLGVTTIPFLMGIASVLVVRSGWTALSTAVTFALALSLVVTRRSGMTTALRAGAAALLVPTLSVFVICLGAQVLVVSASPITLPIIALIVACALPSTQLVGRALVRNGLPQRGADAVRLLIEISSLVTAGLAALVALSRAAAGIETSFLVLVILGTGALATAAFAHKQYAWWVAGVSYLGALWCLLALVGVNVVEPYLVPPGIVAMIIGAALSYRSSRGLALFVAGLASATVPSLIALAASGPTQNAVVPERTALLLLVAVTLVGLGVWLTSARWTLPLRRLAVPTLVFAILTAVAGAEQAVRYSWGLDPLVANHASVLWPVVGVSVVSSAIAAVAGAQLARTSRIASTNSEDRPTPSRWVLAPAMLYLVAGPVTGIRPGWLSVWMLLTLAALLLTLLVITVALARSRSVTLPPAWFTFGVAWIVAVVGWSDRALRVEAFSLPLGIALLVAGIIAMRPTQPSTERIGITSWPIGFERSWAALAPGIIVTLLPSTLATGTDPLTLRAILVIGLALVAILVGSLRKLAAPFIIGLIVLPVENVLVFIVQIGRSISALPWWITLATAGAVLLVIAVTSERKSTGSGGIAARLRDLR